MTTDSQERAMKKLEVFEEVQQEITKAGTAVLLDKIEELIDDNAQLENMLVEVLTMHMEEEIARNKNQAKEILYYPEVQDVEFVTERGMYWPDIRTWFEDCDFYPLDFGVNEDSESPWLNWRVIYIENADWIREIIYALGGGV